MKNAALALVISPDKKILLVKRRDIPVWVLPGGGIEESETPELAAIRETFEESGVTVTIIDHVATYSPVNALASITYLFLCHPSGPMEPHPQEVETIEARFFTWSDLPSSLFPLHHTFISEWASASSVPITRSLVELSYPAVACMALRHPVWSLKYLWTRYFHLR